MDVTGGPVFEVMATVSRRLLPVTVSRESGGARLIATTRHDAPLVSVGLEFNGGHSRDPRHLPGLADLTASLVNEGATGMTPLEWHNRLENDAIAMELQPTAVRWLARFTCLVEDLPVATELFSKWLNHPGLPAGEWKRLIKTYRAGSREQWAQPLGTIDAFSSVQVFGFGHPIAHPAYERSYARVRFDDADRLARGISRQDADVIGLIGGDIAEEKGFDLLRSLIAELPLGATPLPTEPQPRPATENVWILDNADIDQVYLALSRPGIRAGDPDRMALRLADYALGSGGFSSRLMKRVRSEMGHTYSIGSSLTMDQVLGPFQIQSFTQTGNVQEMLQLIDSELEAICNDGFSQEEVEDARRHIHGALPLHLTNPEVILRVAADGLLAGIEIEDLETEWNSIPDIPPERVNEAARRLLGDGFQLALIGPEKALQSQVESRGEIAIFPFGSTPDSWKS